MNNDDRIIELLTGTVEIMGQQLSAVAITIMADDLSRFDMPDIESALTRVRRECTRFSLAAVIERMPNGWPGPEEAWASFPKDEQETGIVTDEAMRAWGIACPLWDDGDSIGARMAFKEAYTRETSQATEPRPKWSVSLGYDPEGREPVIQQGVEQGKLEMSKVQHLLPSPVNQDCGPIVALLTGNSSSIQVDEKTREKLADLKTMLESK